MLGLVWTLAEILLHYQRLYQLRQEAREAVARLDYLLQRYHTIERLRGG